MVEPRNLHERWAAEALSRLIAEAAEKELIDPASREEELFEIVRYVLDNVKGGVETALVSGALEFVAAMHFDQLEEAAEAIKESGKDPIEYMRETFDALGIEFPEHLIVREDDDDDKPGD